jgi:dTDP-4-dehydrorhamnose reductase
MKKVLLIGASGQLGRALWAEFEGRCDLVGTGLRSRAMGQLSLDLGDPMGTVGYLDEVRPEWILLAGAYCNVDGAEAEPGRCLAVNAEGPAAVAAWARTRGAFVVFYSTDSVFDGERERYVETDPTQPLNVYSESKVRGEAVIRQILPERHLILRTAWLYGPNEPRRNFILRFIDEARAGRAVPVPDDQWGSPTYTEDLAAATRWLLERGASGTFHATGPEFVSRVELTRRVCRHFELDPAAIRPTPTSRLGQVAKRPLANRLDCSKLLAAGVPVFRGVDEGLAALRRWHDALVSV